MVAGTAAAGVVVGLGLAAIDPQALLSWGGVGALILGGFGWLYASLRKGIADAGKDALALTRAELEVYQDKVERLEKEGGAMKTRLKALEDENIVLRKAILDAATGTQLLEMQKHMFEAFKEISERTAASAVRESDERRENAGWIRPNPGQEHGPTPEGYTKDPRH